MRQAGRYMEEYQQIRERYCFLEMCKRPEVAAEVTLQPVDKLGVDAAILFSDLLIPVEAMGVEIEFQENTGPVIQDPIRDAEAVESLGIPDPAEDMPFVGESIRIVRKHLEGKVPLIGFSGAPFTLASYVVEGGGSRNYENIKAMMYNSPKTYRALMDKISDTLILHLNAQIEAGAQALQLFDSWVGCMSPYDYEKYVLPFSKKVIDGIEADGVPLIHFATGASALLELMRKAGGDVIGVDWRINLDEAWERIGYNVGIQGNLDPAALLGPVSEIEERVKDILRRAENRPGHIFNLGHGVLPQTPVDNVIAMVKFVKKWSRR
jgi:uroporphyrinogen decarboxylase